MKDLDTIYKEYYEIIEGDTFDFDKFNEYAIVHHSNAIEGSTLTKEETFLLLDENLTPKNKPLAHSLMAIDHLDALKYILMLANNKTLLSSDSIKQLSALIMKHTGSEISAMGGTFDSSKGEYRKVTVRAGTRTFIDYKKVPERVNLLIEYLNDQITKVNDFNSINELAFDIHFQIVSIHPFADGNGRLSRLLMNYIQAYHNIPLTIVYPEDKQDYFNALESTREKEDISIFRKFMFDQSKKYLINQIQNLTHKQKEKNNTKGLNFLF